MKNTILKKIAYSITISSIMCCSSLNVLATSTTNLQNQKNDLQHKINETSSEISGIQSQKNKALSEVANLNSQISGYETQIANLKSKLDDLNSQITQKQKNIEEQQKKYDEQQELLNKRLVAMYQSGNTSYLDMLLSSKSLTDFISKYYLIEELAEYDTGLLKGIQELKTQIENEKASLESSKTEVENTKKGIESAKSSVEKLLKDKQTIVANLSAEEKKLQKELDEFEEDKREIQKEIARVEAENRRRAAEAARANSSSNNSSDSGNFVDTTPSVSISGFICPLSGRSKSDITTGYYGYSGHTGVDFARNSKGAVEGLPVLAAKAGTVMISKAKIRNGSYYSYGEYISINHGDGTYSVYAHMQAGSRKVQVGERVSQGQQIGNVGSTGNSTGPHLHFEIRTASGSVNPTQYLP